MKKLALGTAQFGFPYGIVNPRGQVHYTEVLNILKTARKAGMDTLDTAVGYGQSESVLGEIGISQWQTITKIPHLEKTSLHTPQMITQEVEAMVVASLRRTNLNQYYAVMLHDPLQLLAPRGNAIYEALQGLKARGVIKKMGISVYTPDELSRILTHFDIDLVQLPFNIFDRRFLHMGWLEKLKQKDVEIHVRSIFLQGLLVSGPDSRPPCFTQWDHLWKRWDNWIKQTGQTPVQACVHFPISRDEIDRVLIGVDSLTQLNEILESLDRPCLPPPQDLWSDDQDLINPTRWSLP